ncbi:MAG: PD40 domain-containing protein [Planctomyces sp.]|nr:PD40 domain-containing protein [Planctomyces sp.]
MKIAIAGLLLALSAAAAQAGSLGYYRTPAVGEAIIVFAAEGDLWKVGIDGGTATRLTSHPGEETTPAISPDGATLAFTAAYEGVVEVYTMPLSGGLPTRRTFENGRASVCGWTPDGKVLYATDHDSTLPNQQLFTIHPGTGAREAIPLSQASYGAYDAEGQTLVFTRLPFNGSHTKRYRGGTVQNLWKFQAGAGEAVSLTADHPGTSKDPMWWEGRIYFAADRDGVMNLWSMDADGQDLRQHTHHADYDIQSPALGHGRVVYQLGAELRRLDIASGEDRALSIELESDLDQTREQWIRKPMDFLSAAHPSPDGDRVVLTARGRVFVAPHRQGRVVEAARKPGVRYRRARFLPDGKSLVALSDESGEIELWKLPADGIGDPVQLSQNGDVLRWDSLPSPDGRYIAHHDKNYRLWLLDLRDNSDQKIDESAIDSFADLAWSPDSRFLAYTAHAANAYRQVRIFRVEQKAATTITSDRFESHSPAWSPDGKWLYLLSDRNLESAVGSPWGANQPEPFFDRPTKVYHIALKEGLRSPFQPQDELAPADDKPADAAKKDQPDDKPAEKSASASDGEQADGDSSKNANAGDNPDKPAEKPPTPVQIEFAGIESRLQEVPVPPGNYRDLTVTPKALFFTNVDRRSGDSKRRLEGVEIKNENVEVKTVLADIKSYELSADRKKLLIHKNDSLFLVDAEPKPADTDKKDVVLRNLTLSVIPREEWRQMFTEAWRLERDYFYDRNLHGVDWPAMLEKYSPLVDRVTTRAELSDLIAQMVGELSALHTFVRGGDLREGPDKVGLGFLGARLRRADNLGGYKVEHVFRHDPDMPERASPLSRPGVSVVAGDVLEAINGQPTLSVPDFAMLLRNQAGAQVRLRVKPGDGGDARDVIVVPLTLSAVEDLRYHEWEHTRRLRVEELSGGRIGYVHLRAMRGVDFTDWARGYYPVFNREGLIIDVRHNRGGNIDSWILGRLLRKVWFYWNDRAGNPPVWNMQQAFRGHMAAICNERTASDGEAFAEGFKRLGLGKLFGTRTWGGEIWLSANNFLVDNGIATAAENGVFGPEGEWLIEGHGVEPDVVVDNLPHATFLGEDAQLDAAVKHLLQQIEEHPIPPVQPPASPNKSLVPR